MEKLEWYCMEWDFNADKPCMFNIMRAINIEDLRKKLRYKGKKPNEYNSIKNYEELKKYLKNAFFYRFWRKSEHEMIVKSWPCADKSPEVKVDVYDQILPNLERIAEYVVQKLKIHFENTDDQKIDAAASRILNEYREAFEELAK